MRNVVVALMVFMMLTMVIVLFAQETVKTKSEATTFQYIGAQKCKICHNTAKSGKQYSSWLEHGHSKAYTTLASEASKKVAAEAGIQGDPQKAAECLVCHVTAFNAPAAQKAETWTLEDGVSCEACHGPGSEYKSMKVMKDIHAGKIKGTDYGLIKPTKEGCVTCHNPKSPTYKEFVYEEAVKKIAHPIPAAEVK